MKKTFKVCLGMLVIVVGIYALLNLSPFTIILACVIGLIVNNTN
jgi:uncharacterized membrane protein HdeD (DUF308 family)